MILGPTAGGKSELAVALSVGLEGAGGGCEPRPEVVSADSMQVYRGLEAGTAKPSAEQRSAVAHHLIDVADPREPFSVADWLAGAEAVLASLAGRRTRAILVGGTNLYMRAMLEGMFEGPPADTELRADLDARSSAELHRRLREVDPDAAARIHPNDRRRLTRAIEVHQVTGRPISELQGQWSDEDAGKKGYRHAPILIGLHWEREAINRRINERVRRMFHPEAGVESLPDEVRRLEAAGLLGVQAREALGYKQVLAWLDGRDGRLQSEADAMEATKIATRRFAKQQRTWMRRFRGVHWLDGTARDLCHLVQALATDEHR